MKTGSVIRRHVVRRWRFGKIKHGSDARGMTYLCRRTAGARTSSSWNGERGDMSGASVVAGGGGVKALPWTLRAGGEPPPSDKPGSEAPLLRGCGH